MSRKVLRVIFRGKGRCRNPKASDVYNPPPIPKIISQSQPKNPNPTLSSSPSIPRNGGGNHHRYVSSTASSGKLGCSVAVEMTSENPYNDFKQSIIQMVMERDIYSATDLWELLQLFLKLNLPCHHQFILKAFSDICHVDPPLSSLHRNHVTVS